MERNGMDVAKLVLIYAERPQGWRGSVKTRHFVMALRDYFHEKWGSSVQAVPNPDNAGSDNWALAYLSVVRLQPISEAFDDDASGFVTVAEVNTFTTSRPPGWRYASHIFHPTYPFQQYHCQSTALDSLLGSG
jgi:hypothetical protein